MPGPAAGPAHRGTRRSLRWLHRQLAGLAGDPYERLLRQFGTWHQLTRLRGQAQRKPLTPAARRFAGEQFTAARQLLGWLAHRGRGLSDCTQADLDRWHAQHPVHARRAVRAFLRWAISARHMHRVTLPDIPVLRGAPMTQHRRLMLLQRILTDDTMPLAPRVAACLMLLYAQPATRLVRLTTSDITREHGKVCLRLGDPPSPVPEPFAALLLQLAADRANMNTAANAAAPWLFPGRRAGQPLNPNSLLPRIRDLGIPAGPGRAAALHQLVLQAPAPVIARALGYHDKTTTVVLAEAGGTWNNYVTGEHAKV